jgi:two-component system cell cycle response regulator DivK
MNSHPFILVVDDDQPSRVLASDVLRVKGYKVLTASNGKEAVELALVNKPALILMDMAMPVMTGLDAVRILKADPHTCAIPIVALTASVMDGSEERIRKAGCDGYLAKPVTPMQILKKVRQFVSGGVRAHG